MKRWGAFAVATMLVVTGCGGDNAAFPEDEYVKQVTDNGVTESVAKCVYDGIRDDDTVLEDLRRAGGPNDKISVSTANVMSRLMAACLLGLELSQVDDLNNPTTTTEPDSSSDTTTTTTEPERTTTTKKSDNSGNTTTTTKKSSGETTSTSLGTWSGRD